MDETRSSGRLENGAVKVSPINRTPELAFDDCFEFIPMFDDV